MRFPQLILLSGFALALTIRAEENTIAAPTASKVSQENSADKELSSISIDKEVETTADGTTVMTIKTVYAGTIDPKKVSLGIGEDDSDSYEAMDIDGDHDHIPLYGDDGCVPRPLPEQPRGNPPCPTLGFLDQMIWNQQGDRGQKLPVIGSQKPTRAGRVKALERFKENESKETDVGDLVGDKPKEDKSKEDNPKPEVDAPNLKEVAPKHSEAEFEAQDKLHHHRRRIHHKQKRFLKQFKGRALLADDKANCPILYYKQ
ncbi:hypothetical protein BGX26_002951 [Mortierella sp. AD094]|nr:hypothetical protein BGX26_002951 [Mortierella sp. AD094]